MRWLFFYVINAAKKRKLLCAASPDPLLSNLLFNHSAGIECLGYDNFIAVGVVDYDLSTLDA